MGALKRIGWKRAIAGVLVLGVASSAWGQSAPPATPEVPVVRPVTPVLPPAAPAGLPPGTAGAGYTPGDPAVSGGGSPVQVQPAPAPTPSPGPAPAQPAPKKTTSPGSTTTEDPLLSSRPAPSQASQGTAPAATNGGQSYEGNPPVQDLTALLPGRFKDTKYKWYGIVRLDAIYDFRPMRSTDSFVTATLPVPQGRGQNSVLTPRYTRLGFDTETPIKSLDWTLKTRIETDFFNGNTSGAFGSFPLRLRFAWADFGPFLIGQAASLFMDYDVYPSVIDYQGPGGMVLMRQPIFALRAPIGERGRAMIAIEQPYSDIQWLENGAWIVNPGSGIVTTPGVGRNVQDVPDFTANLRYTGDNGHMQVAGILRKLTFQPGFGDSAFDELGYGINLTGSFHPWAALSGTPRSGDCATPLSKSRFLGQFAAGRGINRYFNDVNGLGLDATFDPANGFRAIPSFGWFAAYEHWWSMTWISNFTYGEDSSDLTDTLPGNTYERANYVTANIIWLPVERLGFGLEYLYGFRKNKDGQRGENSRIQAAFQYKF
ncbi:MAG TPA: DcaP family trimeric outer membrane transporter [Fimbriiglobus sp.]|nr:DcaP family trimeric outer membrane transporter [Fimbriiglobus sp.]